VPNDLKNEEFIWKDLIFRAKHAVDHVKQVWRKEHDYPRMIFSWPSEHLKTKGGTVITHLVSFAIPDEMETFKAAVELATKTKAYGLLLVDKVDGNLKVVLESRHGTRCWTMPIRRHGDVTVLERGRASENTECIGVLWRRVTPQS